VTTAVASAHDDGRVVGRKTGSGLTINTAAGLYETRAWSRSPVWTVLTWRN